MATITRAQSAEIAGTFLQGQFDADYPSLEAVFGPPNTLHNDGKRTAVWLFRDADQTLFLIYDWKSDVDYTANTTWHIGGNEQRGALEAVRKFFPDAKPA